MNMKRGDRLPVFAATLAYSDGSPIDLTGATVQFLMRSLDGATLKVNAAMTIVSATAGTVEYAWGANDTDTPATYRAECEITFADTKKMTVPTRGYVDIVVQDDLST